MSVVVCPGILRVNTFKNLLQFTTCLSNNIGVLSTNDINLYKPTYFSFCVCVCVCACVCVSVSFFFFFYHYLGLVTDGNTIFANAKLSWTSNLRVRQFHAM